MKACLLFCIGTLLLPTTANRSYAAERSSEEENKHFKEWDRRTKKAAKQVFPQIEAIHRSHDLQGIAYHAAQHGAKALGENAVRLASQSWGCVEFLAEVDLTTREVTLIPGTHDHWQTWSYLLSEAKMIEFIALLDFPSLRVLPAENQAMGPDGATLFLESRRAGEYRWFAYWGEHPPALQQILTFLQNETAAADSERRSKDTPQ